MIEDIKNLLKHTSIYALGNILSKIVGFIMIPVYTRYLSPADYGVLELLTLIAVILAMVFSLRIADGIMRFYHEYDNIKDKNRLVSTVQIFVLATGVVMPCLLWPHAEVASQLVFGKVDYARYLNFIFICFAFDISSAVAYNYLRVVEKSIHYITVSLLQLILGLSLNIYLIVVLNKGVEGVLYSMAISNGTACLLLVGYTFLKVKFHFDAAKLKTVIRFTMPFIPAGILMFILSMGDRLLLNRFANLSEVGIYALGYKFGTLLGTFIGGPFHLIWATKRVEIYKSRARRDELFPRVLVYFTFVLSLGGLAVATLIKDVLILIATPEFLRAYQIVPWVIAGSVFYNLFYVVDIGIFVNNKTFWYPIINAIAAAINIGLNFIFIPKYGAIGAAVVMAISFSICPALAFFISQRYYFIRYDFARIIKIIIVALSLYLLSSYVSTTYIYLDILLKILITFSYPAVLYLIGFFDSKEVVFIKDHLSSRFGLAR
jgi:O-antigen/teichoic acid export membrane protein